MELEKGEEKMISSNSGLNHWMVLFSIIRKTRGETVLFGFGLTLLQFRLGQGR
jgi:hypothetical protein